MKNKIIAIAIGLFVITSCNSRGGDNSTKAKQKSVKQANKPIPVQRNILGVELGKSTVQEAQAACLRNGWDYETVNDEYEISIDLNNIIFGDTYWECASIIFYNYKAYQFFFFEIDCKHTKEQEEKRFKTLANQLIKKYPKAKINARGTSLAYTDGVYEIRLEIDEYARGLQLTYSINEKKLDQVIGSGL